MSMLKSLTAVVAAAAISIAPATAQDEAPTMSMVSLLEVVPAKEKQFDDAWKTIIEIASANGYSYTEYVGGSRNERWIVTPVKNFADVDAVFAARDAISEAGGKKFKNALAAFNSALSNSHTFFTQYAPELSYTPEGDDGGAYMEIDTFYYHYGKKDVMKGLLAEYKALMKAKESPYGYQVNWDGIGAEGNSFTIITYAENAVAMAQRDAATAEMLDGDAKADSIFERFLAISTGSETMRSRYNAEASMNVPDTSDAE